MSKKLLCLTIIQQGDMILLGMKKRGIGQGYWNGFGGKLESGETVEQAAHRELNEESGLKAVEMAKVGVLTFHLAPENQPWEVHVFRCDSFEGEPFESDEMKPQWFKQDEIPFAEMWEDDQYWMPLFLEGKKFVGEFDFDENKKMINNSLREVTELI